MSSHHSKENGKALVLFITTAFVVAIIGIALNLLPAWSAAVLAGAIATWFVVREEIHQRRNNNANPR